MSLVNNTSPSMINEFFQTELGIFWLYIFLSYEIVYLLVNGPLILIELIDIPWIDQYRIQKQKPKIRHQTDLVNLMVRETILHQIFFTISMPILYYILNYFGHVEIFGPRPTWWTILFQIGLFILSEDTLFFWTHYLFHTRWLYQKIHKKHHVYKQPTSVTAVLSDPFEAIQTQFAMWFMPVYLGNTHIVTLSLWVIIRSAQTFFAHSGYDFPYITTQYWFPEWMPGALAHDFHHQHSNWSYGSFFSVWDHIMGTHRLSPRGKEVTSKE